MRGWQRLATRALDDLAVSEHRNGVGPAELALLDSQSGPFAARALTVHPTGPELTIDSAPFRVLLLRRLRLPLPDAVVSVRCQRWVIMSLPAPGLAPCAHAGGPLSVPLHASAVRPERLSPQMCWCATSTKAARHDERRIEVIANGLPFWGGAQLAVDTTLVSPLTSAAPPPAQPLPRPASPRNALTLNLGVQPLPEPLFPLPLETLPF